MSELVDVIKMAALAAVEQFKPPGVLFATVSSEKPLELRVDQKLTLTREFLVLSRSVSQETVPVGCRGVCGAGCSAELPHELRLGDVVVLLSFSGGQRFLVLDKVVG